MLQALHCVLIELFLRSIGSEHGPLFSVLLWQMPYKTSVTVLDVTYTHVYNKSDVTYFSYCSGHLEAHIQIAAKQWQFGAYLAVFSTLLWPRFSVSGR